MDPKFLFRSNFEPEVQFATKERPNDQKVQVIKFYTL